MRRRVVGRGAYSAGLVYIPTSLPSFLLLKGKCKYADCIQGPSVAGFSDYCAYRGVSGLCCWAAGCKDATGVRQENRV